MTSYIGEGYNKLFYLSPESLEVRISKTRETRKNKPKEKWIEDHDKRSTGAKNMWANRSSEERHSICYPGLEKMNSGTRGSSSKDEDEAYEFLCKIYNKEDIFRWYNKDSRYPWFCDFYIKSIDQFIELNLFPTHCKEPFDCNNKEHLDYLNRCIENPSNWIEEDIPKVWGKSDVIKANTALKNNLNYKVFYTMEDFYCEYRD